MTTTPARFPCGCPSPPGTRITDQPGHDAWHELVREQTGIDRGPVDAATLRAVRGFLTGTPSMETVTDARHRKSGKRASGAQRRAAHEGDAYEASH